MSRVLAFTVTRAETPARLRLLQETIVQARRTAGCEFDWYVAVSGCSDAAYAFLKSAQAAGQVQYLTRYESNVGQHVAWNEAFAFARKGKAHTFRASHCFGHGDYRDVDITEYEPYDYFLRIDDDCDFKTKRWLAKMVKASVLLGNKMILSPVVQGLKHPPTTSEAVEVKGMRLRFLLAAIGGVCRFHPVKLIRDYVSDVRLPLGAGDATGIAKYCVSKTIPMAYLEHIRVRHSTARQEAEDAGHFATHGLFQQIPYIPVYRDRGSDVSGVQDPGSAISRDA